MTGTHRSIFERSLPIVAAALGDNMGVAIELTSGSPSTNGKTIWLPRVEARSLEEEQSILGILCHEAGHIRFTDMPCLQKRMTEFERSLTNALEDARIEKEMCRLYPGADILIRAAHEPFVKEYTRSLDGTKTIPMYLLAYAERLTRNATWFDPFLRVTRKKLETTFGSRVLHGIERLAADVDKATSTSDVRDIVKRILAFLKRVLRENENCHQKLESSCENATSTSKTGDKIEFSKSSTENETSKSSLGENKESEMTKSQLKELLDHLDDSSFSENPFDLSKRFMGFSSRKDCDCEVDIPISANRVLPKDAELGSERLLQARADSTVLRRSLLEFSQSHARRLSFFADHGRRIATNRLIRFVQGDTKVFRESIQTVAPNTAVHILLDLSGSMGETNGSIAIRAALSLLLGLERIHGVRPALSVFPGRACGYTGSKDSPKVCSVVRFDESIRSINPGNFGVLDAWGSTPLTEAIGYAGFTLLARKEMSKVIIVITDGSSIPETACREVNRLRRFGIRLFGIQIGDENELASLIPSSVLISSEEAGMMKLKEILFGFAKEITKGRLR